MNTQEINALANSLSKDKWHKQIIVYKIEGLIRNALLDQKYEILESVKSVHTHESALDVIRAS